MSFIWIPLGGLLFVWVCEAIAFGISYRRVGGTAR
jgi:hypothetical protein